MNCRICGNSELDLVLDLGYHPPSDAFLSDLNQPETYYPLRLVQCPKCSLAQLDYTVPRETLFGDDYPYETGCNKDGIRHFAELAKTTLDRYNLKSSDLIVDIGSNDGTLLSHFHNIGCRVTGVEPVKTIAERAKVKTECGFWSYEMAVYLEACYGKAKVITATNVFAHVDDLHEFIKGVDSLLADDGVFIIEAPYLGNMIKNLAYDQIYHEHLCYFNGGDIENLVGQYGMNIEDEESLKIHGGSVRYYISKGTPKPHYGSPYPFSNFITRVERHRTALLGFIGSPSSFVGVSAPAKGNTLLNYCGISLPYITDNSPRKIGKFTPGRHIPVYSDEKLLEEQPPFAMILAWNWKEQIKKNLSDYKGAWIIPFPEPHIE
jgi:SAM-dependent methyltransferase